MPATKPKKYGVSESRLTDKMLRFSYEYMITGNAMKSAIAAGYSKRSATSRGAKLLTHPLVKRFIGKMVAKDNKKYELKRHEVLEHLLYLATRDPIDLCDPDTGQLNVNDLRKLPKRIRACIDGLTVETTTDKNGVETTTTTIKFSPKAKGVDMALKHKGLYPKDETVQQHQHLHLSWDIMNKPNPNRIDPIEQKLLEVELEEPKNA